jgi:hypothetical protein
MVAPRPSLISARDTGHRNSIASSTVVGRTIAGVAAIGGATNPAFGWLRGMTDKFEVRTSLRLRATQ